LQLFWGLIFFNGHAQGCTLQKQPQLLRNRYQLDVWFQKKGF